MAAFSDLSQSQLETALAAVDAAITRSLNATSYQIGTRQLARPSLDSLLKLRAAYAKQLAAITGTDIGVIAFEAGAKDDFNEQ